MNLVDVSCGGVTTANILSPWRELPAQIDAVTPDTRLVTVTIGGNGVGLVGSLMMGSCEGDRPAASGEVAAMCERLRTYARDHPETAGSAVISADEAAWAKVEHGLDEIAKQVRQRAPQARLIFVDYIRVVPPSELCAAVPLSDQGAERSRAIASRLEQVTAAVAHRAGAEVVKASELSRGHDACAENNWATGFIKDPCASSFAPYHPTLPAMTAIADALDRKIGQF